MTGQDIHAFLVLLFPLALGGLPLAIYCLAVAYVNRGPHPVLVSGRWDCVGLLFALSGFLLLSIPRLGWEFGSRVLGAIPMTYPWPWLIWGGYFLLVASGAALMLSIRQHKTVIYNVDTARVGEHLARALAALGLDHVEHSGRLVIAPSDAFFTPTGEPDLSFHASPTRVQVAAPTKTLTAPPGGPRYAEITLDAFPAFCHVTLHWDCYAPALRRAIEERLLVALQGLPCVDNPAPNVFLGCSGLIFGILTLLAAFFAFLNLFGRRS